MGNHGLKAKLSKYPPEYGPVVISLVGNFDRRSATLSRVVFL